MAALRDLGVGARHFRIQARGDHVEVVGKRKVDPRLLVLRVRLVERHLLCRLHQRLVVLVGEFAQRFLRGRERALGGNDARRRAVVRGARFLHVGDGDQADFETFLGLLELPAERFERRLRGAERVLGGQHVEIGLRDAHEQVLLRSAIRRLGHRHLRIGALQFLPLVPPEHGLGQFGAVVPVLADVGRTLVADRDDVARGLVHLRKGRLAIGIGRVDLAADVDLRQQQGARLRLDLERGGAPGLGFAHQRVAADRVQVDLDQVLGADRGRAQQGSSDAAGEKEGFRRHEYTVAAEAAQLVN